MKGIYRRIGIFTILLLLSAVLLSPNVERARSIFELPIDVKLVADSINMARIRSHVANLSSFQTRVTSYPGCVEAANYIEDKLKEIGLEVERHSYPLLVPVDQGTNVTILSQGITYEAYALWPNDVQACPIPPEGIEGRLIYVGKGRLTDLDGLEVKDSIVLMEFDSEDNWLNAAKLGAKAAIFIGPTDTIRTEAEQKFILTPLYFPRIYLPTDEGINLVKMVESGQVTHVNIKSRILWQQRTADNIIAVIPGQEIPDEIYVVDAYYDSWSVVPKLSPGAEEAISPAVLLELAELLHKYPPKRTVWLVFYSGHWQAVSGARNFVEDYFFQNQTYATGTKKILMETGVQLSSDSDKLAFVFSGDFFCMGEKPLPPDYLYNMFFGYWMPIFTSELPYNFSKHIQNLQETVIAKSEWFEGEVVSQAGITSSSTFLTTETLKIRVGTPFDSPERISWTNLKPQILFISCAIAGLANKKYENTEVYNQWRTPVRFDFGRVGAGGKGYAGLCNLIGRVEEYNLSYGFYAPVPEAVVEVYSVLGGAGHGSRANWLNPFTRIYTFADERGEFRIPGVKGYENVFGLYSVLGYVIDPTNGSIIYAPDLGIYGGGGGTLGGYNFLSVQINTELTFAKTIVFKSKSVVLYDAINPLVMRQNRPGLHYYTTDMEAHSSTATTITVTVNDFVSHSTPSSYGLVSPIDTGDPIAMLFVDPKLRFEVVFTTASPDNPQKPFVIGLLNNASELTPEGSGYYSDVDRFTGFDYLKDFVHLNEPRFGTLKSYNMLTPSTSEFYTLSKTYSERALEAFDGMRYSEAYSELLTSWNFAANAYGEIKGTLQDLISTAVILMSLIIPCAILFERLIFLGRGVKRFTEIVVVLVLFTIVSYILHPGFILASNIIAVVFALCIFAISIPVTGIILGNIAKYAKELRSQLLGEHFAEIARAEALISAIITGVAHMRKRPLRTLLNMLTISIIVFSLVTFTSSYVFTFIKGLPAIDEAPYPGMMLKQDMGREPFSPQTLSLLSTSLGPEAIICPRSWVYLPSPGAITLAAGSGGGGASWTASVGSSVSVAGFSEPGHIYGPNYTEVTTRALLGITPEEFDVTKISAGLTTGSRPFLETDKFVCIITQEMQSQLGVQIGENIDIKGLNLRVVGVADTDMLMGALDLDGNNLAPPNPTLEPGSGQGGIPAVLDLNPLLWEYVVIVPFDLAYDVFNGRINSIAVEIENVTKVHEVLSQLVFGSFENLEIYASTEEDSVEVWRRAKGVAMERMNILLIPIILGGLTIFVTLVGSVQERRGQIATYSTVGLSPLHITGLFLAESVTYAFIGSLLGYLGGLIGIRLVVSMQLVPGEIHVNFSSTFVLIALAFSMILVMLSSIYPALKAGLMVTPSLKRKWEISTKPIGDDWIVPLPFISSDAEVDGVLSYLSEFLDIYASRDTGNFFVESKEMREDLTGETPLKEMVFDTNLPPWDSATSQKVFLRAFKRRERRGEDWSFQIHLRYITGSRRVWTSKNPALVDTLRKQLLIWRSMSVEKKLRYLRKK